MRQVTFTDFKRFKVAYAAAVSASAGAVTKLQADLSTVQAMAAAGDEAHAVELATAAQTMGAIELTRITSELERAAVGFLGERRRPSETAAGFLARISAVIVADSLEPMLSMQARNGLRFNPAA